MLIAPWSVAFNGRPTLTGRWLGAVILGDKATGSIFLTLIDTVDRMEGWSGLNIEGIAGYCLGPLRGDFELYGAVDKEGNIADLRFRPLGDDPVWLYSNVSSHWRGDTLRLSGHYHYAPDGRHLFHSNAPARPLIITLKRGDETAFAAACAAVGGG